MGKVLVVGNGFDIALGFRSKYSDYINVMSGTTKNAFWPFRNPPTGEFSDNSLYRHFYDYFHPTPQKDIDIQSECNYSAKEPVCRNGSPLSDESKDGIKRGLPVFPGSVGNGMESVESIGAGIGTEAT